MGPYIPRSIFAEYYRPANRSYLDRGDIPAFYDPKNKTNNQISWKTDMSKIDYLYFFPLFVDGIREKRGAYKIVAMLGALDLLERNPRRVLNCLPQIILPIRCKASRLNL